MIDIMDRLTDAICICICDNDKCKGGGCDKCINEYAKKIVEYTNKD